MNLAVASDHAGFPLKARVIETLRNAGHQITDLGTGSTDAADLVRDYVNARFSRAERHRRRLVKIAAFEAAFGN